MHRCLILSDYREMTLRIFHSINFIKSLGVFSPVDEAQKINFRFTKTNFQRRLIIFDLDETLIHSIRDENEHIPTNA